MAHAGARSGRLARHAVGDDSSARGLLGGRLRLAQVETQLNAIPQFVTRNRRAGYSFHSRSFETRKRAAADRHARVARLHHRADQDHRAADRSHRARRERVGRVPSRDSLDTGLRVFARADDPRLGSGAHRKGVGRADAAARISEVRGTRRRLGRVRHARAGACSRRQQVLAIHSNMPGTVPADILATAKSDGAAPAGLSGDELHAFEQLTDFYTHHLGYAVEMSNRPQTLYGLMDSPVGLAAWILDHDKDSYEMIAPAFAGNPGGLSRDDVLDNITMYWLTKTGDLVGASLLGEQARLLRRQGRHRFRPASARFRTRSTLRRRAGRRRPIRSSSTTRSTTSAATLRPGSSRSSSREDVRATFRSVRA